MANVGPTKWYGDSVGWTAVTAWSNGVVTAAGALIRQATTPTVGNERVFVCIIAGTTAAAEPAWSVTKGAQTAEAGGPTWQECTGQPGVNGDTTNSPTWTQNKNNAVTAGFIIFDSVTSSLQIVSTGGTTGNGAQPGFSATAGVTTADNTVTWTSLGAASNFGKFAAPAARLQVIANSVNGWSTTSDTFWLASEHAETQTTAETITFAGTTPQSANIIVSVNKNTVPPTSASVLAGASISTTGSTNLTLAGSYRFVGVNFNVGSGAGQTASFQASQTGGLNEIENGAIAFLGTGASNILFIGANGSARVVWNNVTVQFGNVADIIKLNWQCEFEWKNTASAIQGATIPTNLFEQNAANNMPSVAFIHGVDLSAMTTGHNLWTLIPTNMMPMTTFADCKIGVGASVTGGSWVLFGGWVNAINLDSGATGFRNEWHNFYGDITTETTITLKNGASDGVQSVSHKYISSANATPSAPLIWPMSDRRFAVWNTTTGKSVTATVQIISSGTLNNNDVWLEIEFLGSSTGPLSSFASNGLANPLATAVAVTSSSSTWNSKPATPVTQQLQVSFTPQMVGYVYGRIYVGKASATLWVDPELTVK